METTIAREVDEPRLDHEGDVAYGWTPLPVVLCGSFLVALDFFIVNVALTAIQHDLHASSGTLQWVVAGYGLGNSAGLITGGRLGDMFGRRRVFMISLTLFTLASFACGLAPNGSALIAARVAQGLAGAVMQPQVLAILGSLYTGSARPKAFAAYGISLGLAGTLAQLVGGALITANFAGLGWRSCFLINLPIGLAAFSLAPRVLPHLRNATISRLDPVGMLLAAAAAVALVLPLVEGREQGFPLWCWLVLASALPLLAAFLNQQRRLATRGGHPLIPPVLMRNRTFLFGMLTTLAFYMGNASLYFVMALYFQQALALAPLTSGAVFVAMALGFFVSSFASPMLTRRLSQPPVRMGAWILTAGHALQLVNVLYSDESYIVLRLLPVLFLQGIGIGLVMSPLLSAVLERLPPEHAGVASGALSTVQQVGNALGVAVIGFLAYRGAGVGGSLSITAEGCARSLVYLACSAFLVAVLYPRLRAKSAAE